MAMRLLKRLALALALAGLAVAAYTAWYIYGAWPQPEGYAFPRHSIWGGGPTALFEGQLVEADGCIHTDVGGLTVVWPPGYRLALVDGEPVVFGGSRDLRMAEPIQMGGGFYESGNPPPTAFNIGNCPAPYFLSTGFVND